MRYIILVLYGTLCTATFLHIRMKHNTCIFIAVMLLVVGVIKYCATHGMRKLFVNRKIFAIQHANDIDVYLRIMLNTVIFAYFSYMHGDGVKVWEQNLTVRRWEDEIYDASHDSVSKCIYQYRIFEIHTVKFNWKWNSTIPICILSIKMYITLCFYNSLFVQNYSAEQKIIFITNSITKVSRAMLLVPSLHMPMAEYFRFRINIITSFVLYIVWYVVWYGIRSSLSPILKIMHLKFEFPMPKKIIIRCWWWLSISHHTCEWTSFAMNLSTRTAYTDL